MEDEDAKKSPIKDIDSKNIEVATFAGGCFWCTEAALERIPSVIDAVSGYTGGEEANPTYREVSSGETSHYEAVQVTFDNSTLSYSKLLEIFWSSIDPTDAYGQFTDKGTQYRTAIFYHTEEQKIIAEDSKRELENSGRFDKPIVTEILPAKPFYVAEEYHQDYSKKSKLQYELYKKGSGREERLSELWGK